MSKIQNILHTNEQLSDEQLLQYLQDAVNDDERHVIEKQMIDSNFMDDAVEGLQQFKNKKDINQYVTDLNTQLQKHTANKKKRNAKRKLKLHDWILYAVVIVILLCMLGYFVLKQIKPIG
jgi:CHASE3 domain sensor protein